MKPASILNLIAVPIVTLRDRYLLAQATFDTRTHAEKTTRHWSAYACATCGGVLIAAVRDGQGAKVSELYPDRRQVSTDLPERAREYLEQAISSTHAPAGAVMLAASSVDAMLKAKQYTQGSLYARIEKAVADHMLTADMAEWAHDVRLDANDQRHADMAATLPTTDDATRVLDFVATLGDVLFVLPSRVRNGRNLPPP